MIGYTGPMKLLSVRGFSGSGKTRVVELLVPRFKAAGLRVGTVKHASHTPNLDVKGKDSWRHGEAGAERVLLLGPGGASLFVHGAVTDELQPWLELFEGHVDILVIEGFKRLPLDAVEIRVEETPEVRVSREDTDDCKVWVLSRPEDQDKDGFLHLPDGVLDDLAAEVLATLT